MNPNQPTRYPRLNEEEFSKLAALDSCSVANAIEQFGVQLRNEGYTAGEITCRFPEMPPMVGYAFTLQVRSAAPPSKGKVFFQDSHWWDAFLAVPQPRVLIIQDMDRHPGVGASVGEVHAEILASLGCVGLVTNGSVRDLPAAQAAPFSRLFGIVERLPRLQPYRSCRRPRPYRGA